MNLFPKPYADFVQRFRAPFGFFLVAAFAWLAAPTSGSLLVGLPFAFVGILLRAWAAGHLAKNQNLAISGPYGHLRNPLYLGTLITAAGVAIAANRPSLALIFGLVFLLVYLPAIQLEEQHLRKLFPQYDAYAKRVPLLLPRLTPAGSSAPFRFALYKRNQEYQALAGFLVGALYLAWRAGLL